MRTFAKSFSKTFVLFFLLTFILLFSYGMAAAKSCYLDTDLDKHGTGELLHGNFCDDPGYSKNNLDCDDNNYDIFPDAPEICSDLQDNDCDSEIDEMDCYLCLIRVPEQYPNIQAGIDAASLGCIVLVNDGTYSEKIFLGDKAVTVKSLNGPSVTTIDGTGLSSPVVTFGSDATGDSTLDGFKITQGTWGILVWSSSPTIRNCDITENSSAGIGVSYNAKPLIEDCHISYNTDSGIRLLQTYAAPEIKGCRIFSNSSGYSGGGINISSQAPSATITNCEIYNNSSVSFGAGVYARTANLTIENCDIYSNYLTDTYGMGGGIFLNSNYYSIIKKTKIRNNYTYDYLADPPLTPSGEGGGIRSTVSSPIIDKCIISGNRSAYGGGIYFASNYPLVSNCMIVENTSIVGGGIMVYTSGIPRIVNSTISQNISTDGGGGLSCHVNANAMVVNSIFWGNTTPGSVAEIYQSRSYQINVTYSVVEGEPLYPGISNTNYNPEFDINHPCGPYHLLPISLCRNSGTDDTETYPDLPADDIDGESRTTYPSRDRGADEYFSTTTCP